MLHPVLLPASHLSSKVLHLQMGAAHGDIKEESICLLERDERMSAISSNGKPIEFTRFFSRDDEFSLWLHLNLNSIEELCTGAS